MRDIIYPLPLYLRSIEHYVNKLHNRRCANIIIIKYPYALVGSPRRSVWLWQKEKKKKRVMNKTTMNKKKEEENTHKKANRLRRIEHAGNRNSRIMWTIYSHRAKPPVGPALLKHHLLCVIWQTCRGDRFWPRAM